MPSGGRPAAVHLGAWSVLALTAVLLFASSFERWGDPIIDLGRDLYLPSQILDGRVLYRELLYNYGPTTPYLLAALVAVFGDHLWVFAAFGIVVGVATLAALYAVGVLLGGARLGFAAAFLFLVLGFFANSSWGCNFVLPYSFAATLGTALSMWSFFCLLRYLYGGRRNAALAWSAGLLLAALLTKQEVGSGIAAVHALAWWSHRMPRRAIAATLGSVAVVATMLALCFAARDPSEHALLAENLARFAGDPESAPFFQVVAGLDQPGPHLVRTLKSAGQLGLILLLAALGGAGLDKARRGRGTAVLGVIAVATCAWLVWGWAGVRLFQAVPPLAVGVAGFFLVRDRKDPLLLLAAFALLSATRVLLQFHPMWYGFYLLVPSYPFVVYLLGERAARGLPGRRMVLSALVGVGLIVLGRFEATMWQSYRDKTSVLVTAKGTLRDYPTGRTDAIARFLEYAETRLVPDTPTMVVLPEGVSLNYFTGLKNPTAYYLFTPPEIGSVAVERRVVRELEVTRPEILLLTSRDLGEFGRRGIGVDFALELGNWIRGAYDLERVFEAGEGKPWRLVLLRRRGS